VKSTLHWVSAAHALPAEVRVYDNLFVKEDPNEVEGGHDFTENPTPDSFQVVHDRRAQPRVRDARPGPSYTFETHGTAAAEQDSGDAGHKVVCNRTIGLRDTWAKIEKRANVGV